MRSFDYSLHDKWFLSLTSDKAFAFVERICQFDSDRNLYNFINKTNTKIMSETGRYYIEKNGKTYCVEPIDNSEGKGKAVWGDIDPASKTIQGNYGNKSVGSVTEKDSIVTEENGFKNIVTLKPGQSPDAFINSLED